ncbi:hypothetical protein MNV49_002051 [Pseudohyphozyma bogoriensis]|nr:hypothetical protein MNV49_002051 [Pseudohyphozyma bogoriensis]
MAFSTNVPPTPKELAVASQLEVQDENLNKVKLGDIYKDQKTIVIWIRRFYCSSCQDYVAYLSVKVTPAMLNAAGVKLAIIGCRGAELIKPYRELLETPFDVYADPDAKTYKALGMTMRTLKTANKNPEYINRSFANLFAVSIVNLFKIGGFFTAKHGDAAQLGGDFILGPGETCSFVRRMSNSQDHTPLAELMAAAGVDFNPEP